MLIKKLILLILLLPMTVGATELPLNMHGQLYKNYEEMATSHFTPQTELEHRRDSFWIRPDGKVAKRDALYGAAVTMFWMDAYSTDLAIKAGGREVGLFANMMFGPDPTTLELIAFTGLKTAMLEWSLRWKPFYRQIFHWEIIILTPRVVAGNMKVAFNR